MKFDKIGFNFIEQCNNSIFIEELSKYTKFTKANNEHVDIKFLPFVEFDDKYDAIYYNPKLNNSAVSYYGNAVLKSNELKKIEHTIFAKNVVEDYIKYLRFSNQPSSNHAFNHFWELSSTSYQIKLEPAELFKRKKG